jgi:uncharacterized membrane-anchored protein
MPATAQVARGPEAEAALAAMKPDVRKSVLEFEASLHPERGRVPLPGGHAMLNLGNAYYFLPADEAKKVLVDAWGNPPESAQNVLGMIFPAGRAFYDGGWGAVIEYEGTGHVDDADAASQDYAQVLEDMRAGEEAANSERKEAGYGAVHLVGWAQDPTYDPVRKTLIWARNIKFSDSELNTLNYDVRKLGRAGVLSLNMVDTMDHLPSVRSAAGALAGTVEMDEGWRYADFDPKLDEKAEYGLAGLVAAGAGAAVAKKAGLIGILLMMLKKGFVVVAAAAAAAWGWIRRKLGIADSDEPRYPEDGEE